MDSTVQALRELLSWPKLYAATAEQLGVKWPNALLLHGPPGCGKTAAVHAVAAECGAVLHQVTTATIGAAFAGQAERRLREVFAAAREDAEAGRPVVVFLDEVDALCPRRDSAQLYEARLVAQLLTLLDGAANPHSLRSGHHARHACQPRSHVLVVAATSRPSAVDPALRRPGRFDMEILVPAPDATTRSRILETLTHHLPLNESLNLTQLASECHGYTGADLGALCREAAMNAASLAPTNGAAGVNGTIAAGNFVAAMKRVGPSLARGATAHFEPVSWNDIGGLESVKQRLKQAVEWPLRHADAFRRLALPPPRGILLHGPPGCCKTTLVRAAASASGATLICLSGTQLYSMYVGQGEALLRDSFKRARLVAPSIVFLDELDSIVGKRSSQKPETDLSARLLTSFLTEMDGLELAQGILVMGATNRPQALDAALTRPGRFDLTLYVPPPDEQGRLQALRIHSRNIPLAPDVDLSTIAACTGCFTGAELAAVCREAAMVALREDMLRASEVHNRHFLEALRIVQPQLSSADLAKFESWPQKLK